MTDLRRETDLDQLAINVIRGLAMDAPQKAHSGHPGTAMALAPLAHVLWSRVMTYDPNAPEWPDRDRFVLSCGHACILQYSMLHLTGYGVELEDLKQFRQLHSRTPGHPEVHDLPGIEVTTGPLGQGVANGVGLGIAERMLRSRFGSELVDHHTFVICSDGDLMEGVSHEAASLAGHLGLGKLIYIYDDNHITIDGPTELTLNDDVGRRFEAYGWHVDRLGEAANDTEALEAALRRAMAEEDRPSMLVLRSHIGWPSPHKTDTSSAHGDPLGEDEVRATKEILGLPPDETFWVPDHVRDAYRPAVERGQEARAAWTKRLEGWTGDRKLWDATWAGQGLDGWKDELPTWKPGEQLATRRSANKALNVVAPKFPALTSGGADLTGNTGTALSDMPAQSREHPEGRAFAFGVREHGMGGLMNGMSLHGGVVPIGGTFFIFSDYMRPAVRLAALSQVKVIYFWTHDSVGLGEDGPTHQPIEQLAAMRAMPGLRVIRPADANESSQALRVALERPGPTALLLTRQNVPVLEGTADLAAEGVERGAYVLVPGDEEPDIVLVGTGSEVSVCVEAAKLLAAEGVDARVVSMPSWELFDEQNDDYQDEVLDTGAPVLSVEAATSFGWSRWADDSVAIDHFGASAPGNQVLAEFGFTPENVADRARTLLEETYAVGAEIFDALESDEIDDREHEELGE
ncbi:MAG: transketolase [Acidimicrobiaceae bacterium]|nr:transketolase [Acidimicrobiaceae bacterium]